MSSPPFNSANASLNPTDASQQPNVPPKNIPRKRAHSPDDDPLGADDWSALLDLKRSDNPEDIYGASSFGGYGQYMSRKKAKLQLQNAEMGETRSNIFERVVIYINGKTDPSAQELREMIVAHGGKYSAYLTNKGSVTHIVASNITPSKVKEYQNMKVVRPEWILESIEAERLLPWQHFILSLDNRIDIGQGKRITQPSLFQSPKKNEGQPEMSPILLPTANELLLDEASIKDPIYTTDPATLSIAARVPSYALNKSNHAAQRLMAKEGWREEHTAVSGGKFINNYFDSSRLHHLSAWKAELKNLVAKAQENVDVAGKEQGSDIQGANLVHSLSVAPSVKFKGKGRDIPAEKVMMHCDFDCFFVSVALLGRPELRGKPTVVCHSHGKGEGAASTSEVSSSSYEARKTGIKNGMSLGQARQLCPEVVTLPYEFEQCWKIALQTYEILLASADELEAVSVDEALLDVSNAVANFKAQVIAEDPSSISADFATLYADSIRTAIKKATKCDVSIGIASNIMLARMATRCAKPAGSYHLQNSKVDTFLENLPLDVVHGIGWATKRKAEEKLGIHTLGELRHKPKNILCDTLGQAFGEKLWKAAQGLDDTKLKPTQKRKSVSAEVNFGIRFQSNDEAENFMRGLGEEVSKRLVALGLKARSLTIKVMKRHPSAPQEPAKFMGHGICDLFNKSSPLLTSSKNGTSDATIISQTAWELLYSFGFDPKELRGLGLQATKLEDEKGVASAELEHGQSRLAFPTGSPGKAQLAASDDIPSHELDTTLNADKHKKKDAGSTGSGYLLPSADEIRLEELQNLPEDIRSEIEAQMTDKPSLEMAVASTSKHVEIPSDYSAKEPPSTKTSTNTTPNVKHITRQLRPAIRTIVSPSKISLFARNTAENHPTNTELENLGIDPATFRELPLVFQKEALSTARASRSLKSGHAGSGHHPPSKKMTAMARFSRSPSMAPPSKGPIIAQIFTLPPITHHLGSSAGNGRDIEKMNEVPKIQEYIKKWVRNCEKRGLGPNPDDVEGLCVWMEKCAAMEGTEVGLETVSVVMRWWWTILRERWGDNIDKKVAKPDGVHQDAIKGIGQLWWEAFQDVKVRVDAVIKSKFGGHLSLK